MMLEGTIVIVAVAAAAFFVARSLRHSVLPGRAECEHADECRVAGCCGCEALRSDCGGASREAAERIDSAP
jgi:hypothetical protein